MPVTPRSVSFLASATCLDALDDDLARPQRADDVEVREADRRVHRGVEQLADGAAGRGQRGELELGSGQEVDPPPRPRDRAGDGAQGQLRRDGEPVALVAQPRARHRGVDGEEQGVEACGGGPAGEPVGDLPVPHDIELEPVAAGRVGGLDVLDRGGAEGREAEGDAGCCRRGGTRDLALGLHQAGEAGRGDAERQGRGAAEDLAAGVGFGGAAQDRGAELDVPERLPGAGQRDLLLGGAFGVVEGGLRGPAPGDGAQVVDRERRLQAALLRVQLGLLEPHQLEDLGWPGELTLDHGYPLSVLGGQGKRMAARLGRSEARPGCGSGRSSPGAWLRQCGRSARLPRD